MRVFLGILLHALGVLLNVVTAIAALVYFFGIVVWLHAPVAAALPVTVVAALAACSLAWMFRLVGRSLNPALKPAQWFRIGPDGKMLQRSAASKHEHLFITQEET